MLNLLFNDYGLPSCMAWTIFAIILCIIYAILIVFFMKIFNVDVDDVLLILGGVFVVFLFFISIGSINPYEHIPISGSDIQKANLRRCIVDKTVNLENIKEIMADCQRRDQELKFKAGLESLPK